MNTFVAEGKPHETIPARRTGTQVAVRRAQTALYAGAAAAVALALILLLANTSSGEGFRLRLGDYLETANGIPFMLAPLAFLFSFRRLAAGLAGRLGRAGFTLMSVGLVVFQPLFVYSLIVGRETSFGPTYVLAALASIVGLALIVAGCWRSGLLPRWLLILWLIAWIIGGALPIGPKPSPLLLGAAYLAMVLLLPKRVADAGGSR